MKLVTMTTRLEPIMKDWLEQFAKERGHSRSSYLRYIISQIKDKYDDEGTKKEILLDL